MAYFSNYIDKLKGLRDTIAEDIKSFDKDDDVLFASLIHFKTEVEQMIAIADNNLAIEGKASLMPEGVTTHWWAGSGDDPSTNS